MAKTSTPAPPSKDRVIALETALDAARQNPRTRRPGPKCAFSKVLAALPAQTAAKVALAVDDETNTSAELAEILIAAGFDISAFSVNRHRRRGEANGCRCPR